MKYIKLSKNNCAEENSYNSYAFKGIIDKFDKQLSSLLELFKNNTYLRDIIVTGDKKNSFYDSAIQGVLISGELIDLREKDNNKANWYSRLLYIGTLQLEKDPFKKYLLNIGDISGREFYELSREDFYAEFKEFYERYKERLSSVMADLNKMPFSNKILKKEVEKILHKNDLLLKYEDIEKVEEILKQESENVEKNQISKQSDLKDSVGINQDNNDNSKPFNEVELTEEITDDENNTQQPETGQKLENNETITDNTQPQAVESLDETSPNPSAINNNAGEVTEDVVENQTAEENLENETVENVKDSIIAKVLFGLIVERSKSEEFKKIEDLEQQKKNELDETTQNNIQKQIDEVKASWKLKVENQSDSFEIEDEVPNSISNEYKILNNQNGYTDTISANDNNSLNISHDKDKPVNETSIAVSINTLCNQMEGQGYTPFTFNFNASTPKFLSGIYNTLMADLDAYNKKGMNAICINGKNLAIYNLKNFKDEKEFIDFAHPTGDSVVQTESVENDLSQQSENIFHDPVGDENDEFRKNAETHGAAVNISSLEKSGVKIDGEEETQDDKDETFNKAEEVLGGKMQETSNLTPEQLVQYQQINQN